MERLEKTVRRIITYLLHFVDANKEEHEKIKNRLEELEQAQEQLIKDYYGPHGKKKLGQKATRSRSI